MGGSLCGLLLGFLFLGVLGEQLLVLLKTITGGLVTADNLSFVLSLSAETGLSNEALDLGRLVESLVLSLDLTANDVLADIILLLVKSEGLDDLVSAFDTKSVGAFNVGHSLNVLLSTLHDAEEDGSQVGTNDATAD